MSYKWKKDWIYAYALFFPVALSFLLGSLLMFWCYFINTHYVLLFLLLYILNDYSTTLILLKDLLNTTSGRQFPLEETSERAFIHQLLVAGIVLVCGIFHSLSLPIRWERERERKGLPLRDIFSFSLAPAEASLNHQGAVNSHYSGFWELQVSTINYFSGDTTCWQIFTKSPLAKLSPEGECEPEQHVTSSFR